MRREHKRRVIYDEVSSSPRLECPLLARPIDVGCCAGCRHYNGLAIGEDDCSVRCGFVAVQPVEGRAVA